MAETKSPAWLDAAVVQAALRRGGDTDTVVKSITIRPAVKAGDNYWSTMFRITAETDSGTKSVICKLSPALLPFPISMKEANFFSQEAVMLSEVIPKIHKILDEAAPGRFSPIAASCPYYGEDPEAFIFIEDLAPQGFVLGERARGLGLRHTLLAVRTLARFHAASVALLAEDPSLEKRLFNPLPFVAPQITAFLQSQLQLAAGMFRKWPETPREIPDALESFKDTAFDKCAKALGPLPGRFNVIIHGDFWINNMMFRYEGNDVKDIRLVDFQFSHVASPTVDLIYFLGASVSEDVSTNHLDLVLREYYVALKETMELLGLQAPPFEDLLEDINTNGFYYTFVAVVNVPNLKPQKLTDVIAAVSGDTEAFNSAFESPEVQRWLKRVIPEYYRKGWM